MNLKYNYNYFDIIIDVIKGGERKILKNILQVSRYLGIHRLYRAVSNTITETRVDEFRTDVSTVCSDEKRIPVSKSIQCVSISTYKNVSLPVHSMCVNSYNNE